MTTSTRKRAERPPRARVSAVREIAGAPALVREFRSETVIRPTRDLSVRLRTLPVSVILRPALTGSAVESTLWTVRPGSLVAPVEADAAARHTNARSIAAVTIVLREYRGRGSFGIGRW